MYKFFRDVRRFSKTVPWLGLIAIVGVAVFSGLITDAIQGAAVFQGEPYPGWLQITLTVTVAAGLLICLLYLYSQRRRLLGFGALEQSQGPEGHRGLVLSLSTSNQDVRVVPTHGNGEVCRVTIPSTKTNEEDGPGGDPVELELPPDPEGAVTKISQRDWPAPCEGQNGHWNWEQLVRAVAPHGETLEYVCLLGSEDSQDQTGSHTHFNAAKRLIRYLLQSEPRSVETGRVVFEDVEEFTEKIEEAIQAMRREARGQGEALEEHDLMIDATSGMKTASIAAAVVTLNSHVKFQYVPTAGGSDRSAWYYNVIRRHHEDFVG